MDKSAPISRRQTSKRNKKEVTKEPQEKIIPKCGVIQPLPIIKNIPMKGQMHIKNDLQQLGEIMMEAMVEYNKIK